MILDRSAKIYRMDADPNDEDNIYFQEKIPSFSINIQPETAENVAILGGTFGRVYRAFCTQSGIQIQDKLVLSGTVTISGQEMIVRGVENWNFGPLPHFEIVLEEA